MCHQAFVWQHAGMDPRAVMQATAGKIGDIGAAFYFAPDTLQVGKDAGLDGLRFYILGRGGVLGDVEAGVVRAAFGYFEPGLVDKMWGSAKQVMAPREAARRYIGCAHALGRAKFAGIDGLDGFLDAASIVIGAVEGASLPLFEAVRCEPVPEDAAGAAMHQVMVLRELRGSVHLLALTACGLESRHAHGIKRPREFKLFGYENEIEVTDEDRARWLRAETLTDDILAPAYDHLTADQAAAFTAAVDAMHAAVKGEE
jgi:hypothetical protein